MIKYFLKWENKTQTHTILMCSQNIFILYCKPKWCDDVIGNSSVMSFFLMQVAGFQSVNANPMLSPLLLLFSFSSFLSLLSPIFSSPPLLLSSLQCLPYSRHLSSPPFSSSVCLLSSLPQLISTSPLHFLLPFPPLFAFSLFL